MSDLSVSFEGIVLNQPLAKCVTKHEAGIFRAQMVKKNRFWETLNHPLPIIFARFSTQFNR